MEELATGFLLRSTPGAANEQRFELSIGKCVLKQEINAQFYINRIVRQAGKAESERPSDS